MRRALMELALCHFWAAYDIKSPPIPGAVMRCESVIARGPDMASLKWTSSCPEIPRHSNAFLILELLKSLNLG
jgi:hypothetical protein